MYSSICKQKIFEVLDLEKAMIFKEVNLKTKIGKN
jgi:hypothetical protein